MRKQLALLTFDFPPQTGGVQQYLYEVAQRLTEWFDVTVLTPTEGRLPPDARFKKITVASRSAAHFWRQLQTVRPARVLLGHAHPQLLLAAAAANFGSYSTITHGNDFLAAQRRWHRPLFNALLRRSRPLIVHSHAIAKRLTGLGFPEPSVAHPGVDPTRFFRERERENASVVLLTLSRLVPRKGIDTVLHSLPALLERFPEISYRIGGTGPDRARLEEIAERLGVARAVEFLGRISDKELPDFYRSADIFVMPVREEKEVGSIEGFGLVYLEASASGLPVVAGRSGGAVEAIQDGVTGFLVSPGDTDALTVTLSELIVNEELRRRMGSAGRRWVETEMNWDRTARQVAEALG